MCQSRVVTFENNCRCLSAPSPARPQTSGEDARICMLCTATRFPRPRPGNNVRLSLPNLGTACTVAFCIDLTIANNRSTYSRPKSSVNDSLNRAARRSAVLAKRRRFEIASWNKTYRARHCCMLGSRLWRWPHEPRCTRQLARTVGHYSGLSRRSGSEGCPVPCAVGHPSG